MYEAYCCECMRKACSTRAKLVLSDLEIEWQKVPGLHITLYFDRKQPLRYQTYSDKIGRQETLRGDLELEWVKSTCYTSYIFFNGDPCLCMKLKIVNA